MMFLSRILLMACLFNIFAFAAVTEERASRILYPAYTVPRQTIRVELDPGSVSPDEKVQQEFSQLRNLIIENNLTYFHLANSLKTVLSQILNADEDIDQEFKKSRAQAWLKTVDKLLSNPTLFTDKHQPSKHFRNKFFTQLQQALKLLPSEDLIKTKQMIIHALTGK